MASPARKLLMAGRGGLNLTHSEILLLFSPAMAWRRKGWSLSSTTSGRRMCVDWCAGLEQETFVGTSGRVFPLALKASPLLRAWLRRLAGLGVQMRTRHEFRGFSDRAAVFETPAGAITGRGRCFCAGAWRRLLAPPRRGRRLGRAAQSRGVGSARLRPANCGALIDWSELFRKKFEGQPLKNIQLHFGDLSAYGEAVVTRSGLEGGAVYALSGAIRDFCAQEGEAEITVDLRPDLALRDLAQKLSRPREKQSASTFLRKAAGLTPLAISLLHESGPLPTAPEALAARIKAAALKVKGVAGLERAISTAGGVLWEALDENLMARNLPGLFVAGEMLDWEAPTGGNLLTACLGTGRAAGVAAAKWAGASVVAAKNSIEPL